MIAAKYLNLLRFVRPPITSTKKIDMMQFLFFRKKPKRELPLIKVHTFKTGENLYTYRVQDYGRISSRYYRNLQESANYIQKFGMIETEWKGAVSKIKDNCLKSLDGKFDKTEALVDAINSMQYFEDKIKGARTADSVYYDNLFCMFYILEDETETGYSAIHDDKKLQLLDSEPEMRDFFLTKLKQDMKSYMPTLVSDTAKVLARLEKQMGQWMHTLTRESTTFQK